MEVIKGTGVSSGIAFGKLVFYDKNPCEVMRLHIDDVQSELNRFEIARRDACNQLTVLYKKAFEQAGESSAMIFEVHQVMLEDEDYINLIKQIISSERVNAEYAVIQAADSFSAIFSSMNDAYMKDRAADVKDISERIINNLQGNSEISLNGEPIILSAEDLSPSETVQLDKNMLLGFVTGAGSSYSHTAILARMMGIPAIVNVGDVLKRYAGKSVEAILDGFEGVLYIAPNEDVTLHMRKKHAEQQSKKKSLQKQKGKESVSADGKKIHLNANIGAIEDVAAVIENDAEGIGLFRSEFLFLQSKSSPPDEATQYQAYKSVIEMMAGKKVVIRTLDIGADKQVDYLNLPAEENPAMGYRAIRICLDQVNLFKTQLRAILRAGVHGKAALMFPMITSVWEVLRLKEIVEEVKFELASENIEYDSDIEIGIMIETPAAAIISNQLAKHVDFFSVGTNDLTQYILAVDRQNQKLEKYYDPRHPAVMMLLEMIVKAAHQEGIWAGICGELAADVSITESLLAMGFDELSVAPTAVLPIRERICTANLNITDKLSGVE